MKKAVRRMIEERDLELSNKKFNDSLCEYSIRWMGDAPELIKAHGYLLSPTHELVFFIRYGDELVECGRVKYWNSVKLLSSGNE